MLKHFSKLVDSFIFSLLGVMICFYVMDGGVISPSVSAEMTFPGPGVSRNKNQEPSIDDRLQKLYINRGLLNRDGTLANQVEYKELNMESEKHIPGVPTLGEHIKQVRLATVNHGFLPLNGKVLPSPLRVPVRISSHSGPRIHPLSRTATFHDGIDIPVPTGTPVYASIAGNVTFAGWMSGYGYLVIIKNGDFETRYGHLNSVGVKVGQYIEAGDKVGNSGRTGRVTGPHLHFEIRHGGIVLDPLNYLAI